MITSHRSDKANICQLCRFIARHPETRIANSNPRLHNRKYTMTCSSIEYVLAGPDVNHFALSLPPHTASFGWLYPSLLTESLLLHIMYERFSNRLPLWIGFEYHLRLFNSSMYVRGHVSTIFYMHVEGNNSIFLASESRGWGAVFRTACFQERIENTAQYSSHFISQGHVVMPVIL